MRYAKSRWHESETAAGFRKYFDRETIVLGWCGQSAAPGYALQVIESSRETDRMVQKSLDFLSTTPFYENGLHTWYHPDKKRWEQPGGRPEILSQGQAMQNFANAIRVGRDDGVSPVIRLDSIGKHEISSGSAQQAILQKLVIEPLERLDMKVTQIDKYATEMHNPEATEPQGSGNVPRTNYRTIGSFAVIRKEIDRSEIEKFVETHGMPGFSPTQGHIASAVPVLGHSLRKMREGKLENTMFLAKGSLFLGRMTQLSDGISFILEKNRGGE